MEYTKINGLDIVDLALKFKEYLIISDLHLGYEQSLNAEGIMVPRFQYPQIIARLEEIQRRSSASKIIVNGDLKHEFGQITRQEWNETLEFLEFLKDHFDEIILIKGNHDNFTKFIARKTYLEVFDCFKIGDSLVLHGDRILPELSQYEVGNLIIGHEHPCIGLRSGERVEKIKCYLTGKYHKYNLTVMPSFNFVTEGSDVLQERPLSPFLKKLSTGDLEVHAVENFEVFSFGRIKDITAVRDKFN
ncbi:MAG: metallophosphoesterase [Methanobacterium sp.]|nr:metallophosphoesterase [Methanobacterium sp.]